MHLLCLHFGKFYANFGETLYDSLLSKEDNLKLFLQLIFNNVADFYSFPGILFFKKFTTYHPDCFPTISSVEL